MSKRDRPRIELAKLIKEDEPLRLDYAADCLSNINLWESQVGARAVLEGDSNGWGHLRLGLTYSVWRMRTVLHVYKQDIIQGISSDVTRMHGLVIRSLALAIALRDDELARWCGSLMLREISRPTGFLRLWGYTDFYRFMARLYARWEKVEVDTNQEPFRDPGIYQGVIDHWNDDAAFSTEIVKVSDYHCSRTVSSDGGDPEFWQSPFQVFPAEILAIQRIRHEEAGVLISVDHPLLTSAMGSVPNSIPLPTDSLLEEFKARLIVEEQS